MASAAPVPLPPSLPLASASTGPSYHAALRHTLHAETRGAIALLEQQIQVDGYAWLDEYVEGALGAAADFAQGMESGAALATILKTPIRTAKKNKTRATALADQTRQERAVQANRDLGSAPVTTPAGAGASGPLTLVEARNGANPSRLLFAPLAASPAARTPSRDKENRGVGFGGAERFEQTPSRGKTPIKPSPRSPRPAAGAGANTGPSSSSGIPRSPAPTQIARRALLSPRPRAGAVYDGRTASPRGPGLVRAGSGLRPESPRPEARVRGRDGPAVRSYGERQGGGAVGVELELDRPVPPNQGEASNAMQVDDAQEDEGRTRTRLAEDISVQHAEAPGVGLSEPTTAPVLAPAQVDVDMNRGMEMDAPSSAEPPADALPDGRVDIAKAEAIKEVDRVEVAGTPLEPPHAVEPEVEAASARAVVTEQLPAQTSEEEIKPPADETAVRASGPAAVRSAEEIPELVPALVTAHQGAAAVAVENAVEDPAEDAAESKEDSNEPTGTYDLVIPLRDETVTRLSGDRQSRGPNAINHLTSSSSAGPSSSRESTAGSAAASTRLESAPAPAPASSARTSSITYPRTSSALPPKSSSWLSRALGDNGQNGLRKSLAASAVHKEKLRSVVDEAAVPSEVKAPAKVSDAATDNDAPEARHSAALPAPPPPPAVHRESTTHATQNDTLKALKARLAASQSRPTMPGPASAPASSGLQSTTSVGLGGGMAGKFNSFRSNLGHAPLLFARPSGVPREDAGLAAAETKGDVDDVEQTLQVPVVAQSDSAAVGPAKPSREQHELEEPVEQVFPLTAVRDGPTEVETVVEAPHEPSPGLAARQYQPSTIDPAPAQQPTPPATPPIAIRPAVLESTTPTNTPPPLFRAHAPPPQIFSHSHEEPQHTRFTSEVPPIAPSRPPMAVEGRKMVPAAQPVHLSKEPGRADPAPVQMPAPPVAAARLPSEPQAVVPAPSVSRGLSYSQAMSVGDESREEERMEDQEDLADFLQDVTTSESDVEADVDQNMEDEPAASQETSEAGSRPPLRAESLAPTRPQSAQKPVQRDSQLSQLHASTQSRAGTSADRLAHAERIANKIHGQKPVVTKPSSLNAAAHARMQQQAQETKRKQQRDIMEQRKRQKLEKEQEVAAQQAQQAQADKKKRLEDLDRRRRERAENDKRHKEAVEREALRKTEKSKLAVSGEVKIRGAEAPGVVRQAGNEGGKIKRIMPMPNKGKEPMGKPAAPPQPSAAVSVPQASGSGLNKSMGPPVRPMQKPSTTGGSNPFASVAGKVATGGSTISLVKPGPSRTSVQMQAQKNALAQSTMHNAMTPAPKPARDELTKLQKRIAMGGSASPQVRPDDVELPDISSDFGYSSDDEDDRRHKAKKAAPTWIDSPEIRQGAQAQQSIDPEDLFGRIPEVVMDDLFPEARKGRFRPRSSSANWGGADRLTKQEEMEYAMRMGYKHVS